jgi:mono/diheme cytochrome c family protein
MFALMGRSERKVSPRVLSITHKAAGVIFTILLAVVSYLCIRYVKAVGDQMSVRAVFHGVLALGLIVVLAIKVAIVQYYREFMRFVPTLGIITFSLAFVVFFTSAGFYFLRGEGPAVMAEVTAGRKAPSETGRLAGSEKAGLAGEPGAEGDTQGGRALFEAKCSSCHGADSEASMFGPGLKGVLRKEVLPSSGRAATAANIVEQLRSPVGAMPPFTSLSDRDVADIIAYLKTL